MAMEDRIMQSVQSALNDGTVEEIVASNMKGAIAKIVEESFHSYGDVYKAIKEKINVMLVKQIEGYDFGDYVVKLDAVLSRIVSTTALVDNKRILENFQQLMLEDDLTEVTATDIFNKWRKWAADAVETDGLKVDFDGGEPAYEPVECRMEVRLSTSEYNWSSFDKAVIALICDHDEELNVLIPLRRWKNEKDAKWDVDSVWNGQVASLRHTNDFEIFLLKLSQQSRIVTLDAEGAEDYITPSKMPEASFS